VPEVTEWDDLGARVKQAIQRAGKTQAAVAKDLGVEPSALNRLLKQGRNLRLAQLQRIAAFCGVDLGNLIGEPPREASSIWRLFLELVRLGVPPVVAYDLSTGRAALLSPADRERLNALGPRLLETFASGSAAPALKDLFPPDDSPGP